MLFPIGSKRTATLITWLVLIVFCAVILLGWWYLLEPTLHVKVLVGTGAFLITAIAALSARQIGQLRADALETERRRWYRGWKPYTFLAVISALGTLNAAFVILESRAIVRSDIANVRDSYGTLRDIARGELPVRSYIEKVARIEALLKNLHEEIVNPNGGRYCGVGDSAKVIIEEIKQYIPSFHVLRGTGPMPCSAAAEVERVYRSYEGMAREMIRSDPGYLAANGPDKDALLATIDKHWEVMRAALNELETSASGLGPTDGLDMEALYSARGDYNADLKSFVSLSGKPWPRLAAIGMLQSERVNSYMSTLRLFIERMSHAWSWLYVVFAIGIDVVVIYLLTEFNVRYGRKPASTLVGERIDERFQTDPRYLWVQPAR